MPATPPLLTPLMPARAGVGRYRFIAHLGGGGMADVYLAVASGMVGFTKLSVIKVLRPEFAHDPEHVAMFLNEARLAARLNHPNVVQTNEVGEDQGVYYLVMEYLEGQPLRRLLQGARDWPLGRALPPLVRALCDMLAGLHYAHELRDFDGSRLEVVHRDVSPHNVFVTYDGQVKLVDFGIAKVVGAALQTRAGMLKGKVAYMAPEQARGEPVDRRADVFSAGVLLWEALARARLWRGLPDVVILQRLVGGQLPPLREAAPDAPEALARACERALAPDPSERFASALEMREALEPFAAEREGRPRPDLGALLVGLFGQEREALQRRIEAAIGSTSGPHALGGAPSESSLTSALHPSTLAASTVPGPPAHAGATGPFAGAPGRGRWARPLVAAGALAGLGLLAWRAGRTPGAPPSPAPIAALAPVTASAALAPAEVASVQLVLRAKPNEAKLFLDGKALDANPFRGAFPRGGEHELRAEAPGYVTTTQSLSFVRDAVVELSLARQTSPTPRPAPPARPPRPTGPRPPPAATTTDEDLRELPAVTTKRPVKPIDTESPY